MISLQDMYSDYLQNQTNAIPFENHDTNYKVFLVQEKKTYQSYDWKGNSCGKYEIEIIFYVWLGKKGAIYVTNTPVFSKKNFVKNDIIYEMKKWVWKKYFEIDFPN